MGEGKLQYIFMFEKDLFLKIKNNLENERDNVNEQDYAILKEAKKLDDELKIKLKALTAEIQNIRQNPRNIFLCYIHSKQLNFMLQYFMPEINLQGSRDNNIDLKSQCLLYYIYPMIDIDNEPNTDLRLKEDMSYFEKNPNETQEQESQRKSLVKLVKRYNEMKQVSFDERILLLNEKIRQYYISKKPEFLSEFYSNAYNTSNPNYSSDKLLYYDDPGQGTFYLNLLALFDYLKLQKLFASQFLFCNRPISSDELEAFMYRSLNDPSKRLYVILNPECLSGKNLEDMINFYNSKINEYAKTKQKNK